MRKTIPMMVFMLYSMISQAGIVVGTITDQQLGESLIGAAVQVEGLSIGTITDFDGNYSLELTEGTYTLIYSYVGFRTEKISNVKIGNEEVRIDVAMETDAQVVGEVTVTARRNRETNLALQMARIEAATQMEFVGAKELSVKGISNVQEGVKKVTGISIADAGQLIVRGLGDRYSITTLNGLPIASPNPDNKLVPLNLFPSSVVENIAVSKVYDASAYADYSGAHIDISTKKNVSDDFLSVGISTGGFVATLGRNHFSMDRNGSLLRTPTMDSKALQLPLIEYDKYVKDNQIFNTTFAVTQRKALPDLGGDLAFGKRFNLGNQELNIIGALNLSNGYEHMRDAFYKTLEATGNVQSNFGYDSYEEHLNAAALLHADYTLRRADRIGYTLFYARNASDTYEQRHGTDAEGHNLIGSNSNTHIYTLINNQVSGIHNLTDDDRWQLDWAASYGTTSSNEPDRRQVMFAAEEDGIKLFKLNRQETMRYFGSLNEEEWNGNISLKWKWNDKEKMVAGLSYKDKSRDYMGTRFYYNLNRLNPVISDITDTDPYLNQENVTNGNIVIERKMQPKDSYLAANNIAAAYLLADIHPVSSLLVNMGVRYEQSHQWVRYATDGGERYTQHRSLKGHEFFPVANLRYTLSNKQHLRFSASRTVTRPSFIEMAPFLYQESYGSAQIRGNENLQNGYNYNLDLRYEFFGEQGDMLSVTAYYKYLETPIERIQALQGGATLHSFQNAEDGLATGVELEVRKQLGNQVRIGSNVSYMYTNIALPEGGAYTNKERSLQGASPILLNADATWAPRLADGHQLNLVLLYNLQGERIHAVGVSGLGDIKQKALHTLNFNANYTLNDRLTFKLQAEDLLNRDVVFMQEVPITGQSIEVERYKRGIGVSLGVSYKL